MGEGREGVWRGGRLKTRSMKQYIAKALFAAATLLGASSACAAEGPFPNRPIRIITAQAGGGNDFAARIIARGLTALLGTPVVVDNRGGSVVLAAELITKAQPDGYTLMLYGNNFWLLPYMRDALRFDPVRDFAPVTLAVSSPNVLVVSPSLPVQSPKDLIALARSKPGQLNFGAAPGGLAQIAAELFKSLARIDIVHVPYKGGAPALADLMAGQVQIVFPTAGAAAPYLRTGKVKALAVTSMHRSPVLPDLPTIDASGLPGYESVSRFALFAPARTPRDRIRRLNESIVSVLQESDVKQRFHNTGIETVASSPEELAATMKREMATLGAVIRNAGIRADAPR
jgi:tripartite-type tricarboxylate transporter receptor subunit TctC